MTLIKNSDLIRFHDLNIPINIYVTMQYQKPRRGKGKILKKSMRNINKLCEAK